MLVARSRSHYDRVVEAATALEEATRTVAGAETALRDAVRAAVTAGDSWSVIGVALGVSRQAAQKRFGKDWTPPPRRKAARPPETLGVAPFDPEKALRRQQVSSAALLRDPRARAEIYGDGLDDELDDGYQ